MSACEALAELARQHNWQHWDHSERGRVSHTYGIQDTACLHVRFDRQGRVKHAIYVHFPSTRQLHTSGDQFIYQRQKGKRELVEHILRTVPEKIPSWFPDNGQACGGHRCDGSTNQCFECEGAVYVAEVARLRARLAELE